MTSVRPAPVLLSMPHPLSPTPPKAALKTLLLALVLTAGSGASVATAADRVYWRIDRQATALRAAFTARWAALSGSEPQLLDHDADTVLHVDSYQAPLAATPGRPQLLLNVPRSAAPAPGNVAGIYGEASPEALLALWQTLLPDRQPAGVLVGDRLRWLQWRQHAHQQRLPVSPGFIRPGELPQRVFQLLRPRIGVLLYSADLATDDALAITVILRESLGSGLPVLGLDPALLPAGAVAVLHQDAAAQGRQAAELGLALLQGNSGGWQEPESLQHQINYQVARTLRLPLSSPDTAPGANQDSAPEARSATTPETMEAQP